MAYIGRQLGQGVRNRFIYTATAGQTTFSGSDDNGITLVYTDGTYVDVNLNGVELVSGTDYTATSGTSIVLTTGASLNDTLSITVYDVFAVADTVSAQNGGTFSGDVNVNGDLAVDTNTLFVDASTNNVGIGTASPSALLHLDASSDGRVARFGSGTSDTGGMYVTHNSGSTRSFELSADNILILDADRTNGRASSRLQFNVDGSERMRIDPSGNVLVGTTGSLGGQVSSLGNGRDAVVSQVTSNSNSPYLGKNSSGSIIFIVSGLGTIFAVNTTVQSVSDVRTKENIRDSEDGLQVILGIRPRRFDFKKGFGNDRKNVLGFIGQEIESVFPDAVDTMPDGSMPDSPEDPYKSVGPAALIPVLVKAIQEQQAIIEDLEARVTALETP